VASMNTETAMTVGELAGLSGLTVRTLHHYDELGLVVPGARSAAGYRLYGDAEVERLQEVLFYRELGFGLDQIKAMLAEAAHDRHDALVRQRRLLEAKTERTLALIDAIDRAIDAERNGMKLSKEEMLEVFGDFDPGEYEEEAKERWGDTDAYQASTHRTSEYTKEDWLTISREADEINQAFIALMEAGEPADGAPAMDLAEQHRRHISSWFYDCSFEIHAGLGRLYVEDGRFTENIDRAAPGLARYLSEAIAANAVRGGSA
jgi:MerR family transcriptional regulator, thiopeptide resistance regulator